MKPAGSYGKARRPLVFLAFIIAAAGFTVYFNSLHNKFMWDDRVLIAENESIKDWRYLKSDFVTHLYHGTGNASNFYRPILKLSFMADWSIWQENVIGWHLTNIILHVINAIFIFFIFGIILKDHFASFIGALLFTVHPLFTSAVTYISGRADPLALAFMLTALLFFIKKRHFFSVLFFIAAILTKETAIILPLLLYAYHAVIDKKRFGGVFYLYILICAGYGVLRATVFNFPFVPTLTGDSTLYLRLLTMAKILFAYLKLLILPIGLHMERNVPYVRSFFEWQVVISFIGLGAIGYFIWKRIYKRDDKVFFGLFWFLIALLPISNIMPLNMSMAEHWMYVPAIGIFACVGIICSRLMRRGVRARAATWIIIIGLVLYFSYNTILQNRTWKNEKAFYERFLRYVPDSYVAHSNMGNIYSNEDKIDLAIREYKKALEICPHYMAAHFNLARRYLKLGERKKAVWHCKRASEYFPTLSQPHYELAIIYEHNYDNVRYGSGFQRDKAIEEYKKAIELEPGYFWPHFNLAVVYEFNEKGKRYADPAQMELAKREYEKALRIDPHHRAARENLRILLRKLKY